MTTIYTRSPYKVAVTGLVGQVTKVKLYIYNAPSAVPATPTRVLSKIIPTASLTTVYFNISPYVQEYINHVSFSETSTPTTIANSEYAFVKVEILINDVLQSTTTYKALNGYGYNEDGWNFANLGATTLITEGEYLVTETTAGALYFDTTDDGFQYEAEYFDITTGSLLNDFTFTNGINKIPYVDSSGFSVGGNRLKITRVTGGVVMFEGSFRTYCNGKYTPINCDFVNRYGVWQRLTLFGADREQISTETTSYQYMNRLANYNPNQATKRGLNTNGRRSLRLNTGLVDEFYKDVILQLSLSQNILINEVPYNLITRQSDLPNHINQKQINYSLDFEASNLLINTGV